MSKVPSAGEALYYMHARSYSPALGRFLQPDPARADGSLYAYAGNSPVTMIDPLGTSPLAMSNLEWFNCLRRPGECMIRHLAPIGAGTWTSILTGSKQNAIRRHLVLCDAGPDGS